MARVSVNLDLWRGLSGRTFVEFRILGPIEMWAAGRRYDPGSPKEACVLASLLLQPGWPVSVETIVDHLWGLDPPPKARSSVWSYIARLRRTFAVDGQTQLVSRSGLYVLETDSESVDLHRFRQLRLQAQSFSDDGESEHAAQLLREADSLWHGEALAGLPGDWARRTRVSLENERLGAVIQRVEWDLAAGNEANVAAELAELILEHPFNERIVEQLMVALYRSGQAGRGPRRLPPRPRPAERRAGL